MGPFRMRLTPVLSAALMLAGCTYEDVVLHDIAHVRVDRFDGSTLAVTVQAVIENPNNFRVHVSDPDIDIHLNGTYLGKAALAHKVTLLPRTTATYEVPLHTVRAEGSGHLLGGLLGVAITGRAELRMAGTVRGGAGRFFRRKVPVEETYALDLRSMR